MIRIEPYKYGGNCNNCGNTEGVKTISVGMVGSNTRSAMNLCGKCRRDLSSIIRRDMGLASVDDVARGIVMCRRGTCTGCPYNGYETGTCERKLKEDIANLFVEG